MQIMTNSTLKFIDFHTLDKWFVSFYLNPNNLKSSYKFIKLKELIKPKKDKIKLADYRGDLRVVKKISFSDGKIHIREENETKMDLYTLYPKDLLVSKINFHQGAIAINNYEKIVCTTHYQPYSIDRELVIDEYLILALRNTKFQKHLDFLRADGIKNEATSEFIGELEIPLPSLSEQNIIVNDYFKKVEAAENLLKQANNLKGEMEKYFFDALEIIEVQKRNLSKALNIVPFFSVEKWGVEYILSSNSNELLKSRKYPNVKLSEIVQINPTTRMPKDDLQISFIPMECISDEYGEVIELRDKKVSESKGYKKFQEGDLIWARITPCMQNGKSAIVKNLENNLGCGSTEFHVIRNYSQELDLNYVYHILRLKTVLLNAMSCFTGSAGQQRVPKSFLEDLLIPVPPITIQNEISSKMTKLKSTVKDLEYRATAIKKLAQTTFEKEIFSWQ